MLYRQRGSGDAAAEIQARHFQNWVPRRQAGVAASPVENQATETKASLLHAQSDKLTLN
jgi:hypothetical protein